MEIKALHLPDRLWATRCSKPATSQTNLLKNIQESSDAAPGPATSWLHLAGKKAKSLRSTS
eukprot:2161361-Alexandrium_andersonii.AAC.1